MSLKSDITKRVAEFVIENKRVARDERPELVRILTEEIVLQIVEAGGDRDRLGVWEMRHPDLLKKKGARMYSIADVLADYIMDIDQVDEHYAEYPVYNAEKEYRDNKEREKTEVSLILDKESEGNDGGEWPAKKAKGVISENSITHNNSIEDVLFDGISMSAKELAANLTQIKKRPDAFIRRYADGSAWNRTNDSKRRTPINVRHAIERIELRRVRKCVVCGNGFYSHSKQPGRQNACDVMNHPKNKKMSVCQHTRDRMLSRERNRRTNDRVIELNSSM